MRTKARLRVRAVRRQRSMEEEARDILRAALSEDAAVVPRNLAAAIGTRFRALGGVELALPPREASRERPRAGKAARK